MLAEFDQRLIFRMRWSISGGRNGIPAGQGLVADQRAQALLRRLGPSTMEGKFPLAGLLATIYDLVGERSRARARWRRHATPLRFKFHLYVCTACGTLVGSAGSFDMVIARKSTVSGSDTKRGRKNTIITPEPLGTIRDES